MVPLGLAFSEYIEFLAVLFVVNRNEFPGSPGSASPSAPAFLARVSGGLKDITDGENESHTQNQNHPFNRPFHDWASFWIDKFTT